jgi:hypothetical protein
MTSRSSIRWAAVGLAWLGSCTEIVLQVYVNKVVYLRNTVYSRI